jgi:YggT family protein
MAQRIKQVSQTVSTDDGVQGTRLVPTPTANPNSDESTATGQNLVARVIWYIAGILLALLAFRFVLALLGANPNNSFANFIYSASHPFVAPFFSLFGYNLQYGVSRFETFTLVSAAVYAIVAYGLAHLVTINKTRN